MTRIWTRERTERLRSMVRQHTTHHDGCDCILLDAADAIEELAEQIHFELTRTGDDQYPHESPNRKIVCRIGDIL